MSGSISHADPASFRDPAGRVFVKDGRVYRAIYESALDDWTFTVSSGFLDRLAAAGRIVSFETVRSDTLGADAGDPPLVLEHSRLPFVSYPYEWPFKALKAAALHHLDIQIEALDFDVALSDASAYNVQFIGARPIFIDLLSFRRYREGEFWIGHRQFCEQFLNPLLLRALVGIPHNAWYRGSLEGIASADLSLILPFQRKMSWNVLAHVVLQASLHRSAMAHDDMVDARAIRKISLTRPSFRSLLVRLRRWISHLVPAGDEETVWGDYAKVNSYTSDEVAHKRAFVAAYVEQTKPSLLWDIGCNTGDYSALALEAGAKYAIGFDFDQGALDGAFERARSENLRFQPLFLDAANPSPNQGWRQAERKGLRARADADGLLALALVHHMAIGRNIPLTQVCDWLVDLAPTGVVEFVPKEDPMVGKLLKLREDIFPDYSVETFASSLGSRARIVRQERVSPEGRTLFQFDRQAR